MSISKNLMDFIANTDFSGPIQGILVTAIVALCGVVTYLFKDTRSRMDADKTKMESEVQRLDGDLKGMQTKLDDAIHKRQESDLKALRSEIAAQLPCGKDDCPKLKNVSYSLGQCPTQPLL